MRSLAWSAPRRVRPWLLAVVALAMSLQATSPAFAWGEKGHRLAGALADSRLTPAARAAIAELLAGDDSLREKTLAGISDWADRVGRQAFGDSGPWHYVNVPIAAPGYRDEDCDATKGCIISKIREFRAVLGDRSANITQRREALLFFVHLVEDLHQPLHVGDNHDRGGNLLQVQLIGLEGGTNLHKVWDVDLIDLANLSEASWLCRFNDLALLPENQRWSGGSPIDWANESLMFAKQAYHLPRGGRTIESGDRLDSAYAGFALPIIQQRLAQSGVRLANELNQIFK